MEIGDKQEFARIWKAVREEYGRPVTQDGLTIVFNALSRFSLDQIKRAITLHVNDTQNGQFPIMPAHVVAQIEGRADERSGAAWEKLYRAVGSVGNYSDVVFDDPIIHAIVSNQGGWEHVCMMTEDDFKYFQSTFTKQYTALVSKSGDFTYPRQLTGAINRERLAKGLDLDPPQTVGDVDKCRLVYRGGTNEKVQIGTVADLVALPEQIEGAA